MPEFILEAQSDRVRRITLNRPKKRNAMDAQMQSDLFGLIDAAMRDPDTGVVVLAGAGKSFCSGADMKPTREPPGGVQAPSVSDAAADMTNNRARVDRWLSQVVRRPIQMLYVLEWIRGSGSCEYRGCK